MPEEARPGWEALVAGPPPPDCPDERRGQWERDAIPTARWIADRGVTIGIRTPNVWERARALDLEEFYGDMADCGLDERALFTAQGNAFDHIAVSLRIGQALRTWTRGGEIRRHPFPPPGPAEDLFQRLRESLHAVIAGAGRTGHVDTTIPRDLHPILLPEAARHLRDPFCTSQLSRQRTIAAPNGPQPEPCGQAPLPAAATGRRDQ